MVIQLLSQEWSKEYYHVDKRKFCLDDIIQHYGIRMWR